MPTMDDDDFLCSLTEFHFENEQADAIVRTTAYRRRDLPLTVIQYSQHEQDEFGQSVSAPFQRTSNAGLGSFDKLPTELLFNVLSYLDMDSLFKFRQINPRARLSVNSLSRYQKIALHGHVLFRALLQTGIATHITVLDFYAMLCTKKCAICGQFAGYVSILSWTRCCFKCLQVAPETQVRSLYSVRKHLWITKAQARKLKLWSFNTLPGNYAMDLYEPKSRIEIVSLRQAILARGIPLDASLPDGLKRSRHTERYNFMGSCVLPYYDNRTDSVENGVARAGCQLNIDDKYLIGDDSMEGYEARDMIYARDGFLDHFRWCEKAQCLWLSSDEGKIKPLLLPEAVIAGGYLLGDISDEGHSRVCCKCGAIE